jgi:hypothetical protein
MDGKINILHQKINFACSTYFKLLSQVNEIQLDAGTEVLSPGAKKPGTPLVGTVTKLRTGHLRNRGSLFNRGKKFVSCP